MAVLNFNTTNEGIRRKFFKNRKGNTGVSVTQARIQNSISQKVQTSYFSPPIFY